MPTDRSYPVEHYPGDWYRQLKLVVREPDRWLEVARASSSPEAARIHRKVKAMLRGFQHFPGQDPLIKEMMEARRIQLRKRWDPLAKVVFIEACVFQRPSEAAAAFLEQLKQKSESN